MRTARGQVAIGLLAGSALGLTACGGVTGSSESSVSEKGPIKVGVIEPLTGSFGFYGKNLVNSAKVEVDRINAAGGLLGRKLEVVSRDDKLDPQVTVSAARELAQDPSVGMIEGPSFTNLYNASKNVYAQNKKINCADAVNDDDAIDGQPYTFRTGTTNSSVNGALLKYLGSHGVKTLGLVYSRDATGESTDASLKQLAPKYGIKYEGVKYFTAGAQNQISQARAFRNADALYVSGNATDAAQTALAAKQVGFKGTLVAGNGLQGFSYVENAGSAAEGSIFASDPLFWYTQDPQSSWPPAYREHVDAVAKKYGSEVGPKTGIREYRGTTLIADCLVHWSKAVKEAGSFDADKVKEKWEKLALTAEENPSGVAVEYTPEDHDQFTADKIFVYKWVNKGGKWYVETLAKAGS